MEEVIDQPKWLVELENRKRKPRLAHEAGAGAPCMKCNAACPGLDLHFWRKICKNCKCGRDDHDVDDDEFPQFDLLFGPSGKFKKKSMRLKVDYKRQNEGESTFEWVPPDTTKELVMDYMKALPVEKLPIKGSAGAALRRQLLQKQLPLHDIDHKCCDELSEQEQKQFEKYLENIKNYVGQGKVMKILGARPFDRSLMTPINATDMNRNSSQHKQHIPSTGVQLRTPSSFVTKGAYPKYSYENQNKQDAINTSLISNLKDNIVSDAERFNCSVANIVSNSDVAKYQPVQGEFHDNPQHIDNVVSNERGINNKIIKSSIPKHIADQEIIPICEKHFTGNYANSTEYATKDTSSPERLKERKEILNNTSCLVDSETVNSEVASIAESMLIDALLPPSAIRANDIIGSTLDEKELMYIREKLSDKYNATKGSMGHTAAKSSGLLDTNDKLLSRNREAKESKNFVIDKDVERTANITDTKNSAETLSEKAERISSKPLSHIIQLTPFTGAGMNEQMQYNQLLNYKPTDNDMTLNMEGSKETINTPTSSLNRFVDPAISISNSSSPAELNSSVLQSTIIHSEPLQNQIFPYDIVGCSNESIENTQSMEYLKNTMENLQMDSTKIQKCQNCHEEIRIGNVAITTEKADNAFWHPGCFVCSVCDELLVDLVYFHYKNKLYCGRDLAAFLGIPRCFACDELIFVREYTVAEGHNYHVKHFCCWDCDMPLAGQQYTVINDRPLCLPCYQKTYAKTCAACNIVIAADQQGVAIKNLHFHAVEACFCCYSCRKNLLNGRMAIKEDKLFCSKECIAKFLNR